MQTSSTLRSRKGSSTCTHGGAVGTARCASAPVHWHAAESAPPTRHAACGDTEDSHPLMPGRAVMTRTLALRRHLHRAYAQQQQACEEDDRGAVCARVHVAWPLGAEREQAGVALRLIVDRPRE